jgi:hypothetical protein
MRSSIAIAAAAVLSMFSAAASSAPVLESQSQTLTSEGQDMSFIFGALPGSNGSGGFIAIFPTQGTGTLGLDLSGAFPLEDENFEVAFDGVSQGFFSCGGPSNNGSTAIAGATDNSVNFNDCVFNLPLALADSFLADGSVTVGVLFGDDVSTFGHNDVVNVSLRYESAAVPEPGMLALTSLGLGLVGLARTRRTKK